MRGPYRTRPVEDRYWAKVTVTDGCWGWIGATVKGYGVLNVQRRLVYVHRLSWALHNGAIPDGMHVLHRCDNPPCSNPSHLFLGTATDNLRDAAGKFRTSHGEGRPNHKATEAQVLRMRALHEAGVTVREMAPLFPVSERTIRKILTRKNWRHI